MTEPLTTAAPGGPTTDDADFERFYARWHPTVCRWAMQQYGASLADEIAQETLSRAFLNFRRLRRDLPWPWLLTVARNVACDLHRATVRCSGHPSQYLAERPDPYPGPEELAMRTEVSERVRDAMSSMPVGDRQLLTMSVDDMSIAEMARALGTSEGAVRVRLHRARKRLGHLYLAKGGNLAVTPLGALTWTLRKLRRGMQQAIPAAAPTTALLAATATVATVGIVVAGLPAHVIAGKAIRSAAVQHHVRSAPHHEAAATSARPAATRAHNSAAAGAQLSTATAAAPVSARATARVAKDPTRPGKLDDHEIRVVTPAGTLVFDGWGIREQGESAACHALGATC
ncbi:MAG: hypothetical protein QOJ03_1964 [Frankiaceae bacterium]|jgi:RNA polymerase sigma-70 factor (ECF subfamily)|nr:hypothetical protein [Frankiaceae bacterium]